MKKILLFIVFILLDLITKYFVKNNLLINQSIELTSYFDIVYVQNYGVSFGLLSGSVSHWLLIFISTLVVFLIFYLMSVTNKKMEKTAYFIILIGALANITDRAINSFVVDFILIHYKNFYWPAFNLADIYITLGIIMLLISFLIKSKEN